MHVFSQRLPFLTVKADFVFGASVAGALLYKDN